MLRTLELIVAILVNACNPTRSTVAHFWSRFPLHSAKNTRLLYFWWIPQEAASITAEEIELAFKIKHTVQTFNWKNSQWETLMRSLPTQGRSTQTNGKMTKSCNKLTSGRQGASLLKRCWWGGVENGLKQRCMTNVTCLVKFRRNAANFEMLSSFFSVLPFNPQSLFFTPKTKLFKRIENNSSMHAQTWLWASQKSSFLSPLRFICDRAFCTLVPDHSCNVSSKWWFIWFSLWSRAYSLCG